MSTYYKYTRRGQNSERSSVPLPGFLQQLAKPQYNITARILILVQSGHIMFWLREFLCYPFWGISTSLPPITLSSSLTISLLFSVPAILSFQECRINGILWYLTCRGRLFSLNIIPSTSIRDVVFIHGTFLSITDSMVCVPQSLYNHPPIERRLGGFQFRSITNKTTLNIWVSVLGEHEVPFLWDKCTRVQLSFVRKCVPTSNAQGIQFPLIFTSTECCHWFLLLPLW